MNKRKLLSAIPNHGWIGIDAHTTEIQNGEALVFGLYRDGTFIWADIEFDDGFGRCCYPFNDLWPDLKKYIYGFFQTVKKTA